MRKPISIPILVFLCAAFFALPALAQSPELTVWSNPDFGSWVFDGSSTAPVAFDFTVTGPDGLGFSWVGNAEAYGGTIEGYRMGWDLLDPDDPMDPGWLVADYGPALFTAQRVLGLGIHTFTVEAKDTDGGMTRAVLHINVVELVPAGTTTWGDMKAEFR